MANRGATRPNRPNTGNKICQFKLVLLGEPAFGKSSLVLRFVKGHFHGFQESTMGALLKQLIFSFSPPLKGRDFNCSYLARTIINNVPVICNISIGYVSNNLAALFSKVHFILIRSVYCTNCFRYFHYMKSTMCQR
uniref:Uncharacterized protein n=1 Tax=Balaenoptera musculus TaxID=9771 RepID=A0A8C0C7N8_BALMU